MNVIRALGRVLIPAYAGVILMELGNSDAAKPYPRVCGGDPTMATLEKVSAFLSPRMRG